MIKITYSLGNKKSHLELNLDNTEGGLAVRGVTGEFSQ